MNKAIGLQSLSSHHRWATVLDEVQRIWLYQFNEFVEKIKKSTCMCIFSYDELQVLDKVELENDIPSKIDSFPQIVNHSLSKKIRTNKEVATFIRGFLNNKKMTLF